MSHDDNSVAACPPDRLVHGMSRRKDNDRRNENVTMCAHTRHMYTSHTGWQTYHEVCDAHMNGMALPFGVSMPSQAYHIQPQHAEGHDLM